MGNIIGIGNGIGRVHLGALSNQIDLNQLPDETVLLATEEGYVMSETDNLLNLLIEE